MLLTTTAESPRRAVVQRPTSALGLGRAKTRWRLHRCLVTSAAWRCVVIFGVWLIFLSGSASDPDFSRPGRFCNSGRTYVGGGDYALIAAISGLVPMMFMTRVIL
jgi:hypothetical protein